MNSRRDLIVSAVGLGFSWSHPVLRRAAPAVRIQPEPAPSAPGKGPVPALGPAGVVHDGRDLGPFGIDPAVRYPNVRSHRRKFGVLLPATNTTVEHELWRLILDNRAALDGVGLHATPVSTPRPVLRTEADLDAYRRQFVGGLGAAIDQALLAEPDAFILAMSMEHILYGLEPIRATLASAASRTKLAWATWHDAASAALRAVGAQRIGLLTPFDRQGNKNARRLFEDLGFEVVSSVGFACANAQHIAHVPDAAKERAVLELLATKENRLDAVVQCGTNMSFVDVAERLEPRLGLPLLSINAVTFWHALRQGGITAPLVGGGRLLRE
ncbi:MAG TPA: hypothetical protein VFZ09_21575 [Archangium sp.]|uniref:maleate cis-trans isomerase family protein n=1 Tax=Archangium sp. TaxID=1872627 RepID=UPI002E35FD56|nr:hypothetical protein [Archangium sp.]HEX5748845.1 hypothetical protein [Archangium sp.]